MKKSKYIKLTSLVLATTLSTFALVGCGSNEDITSNPIEKVADKKESEIPAIDLTIDITENIKDGKVTFEINTNLPDGTEGSLSLINEAIGHRASSSVVINNGKYTTEEFSNKGEPLVNGLYKVSFSTPIYTLQPETVQKAIGEDYANINSEYVMDSNIGKNIVYEKEVDIKASDVSEQDIIDQSDSDRKILIDLYASVETEYSNNKNNLDMPGWAKFGRDFNDKTRELHNSIKDTTLKLALGNIIQLKSEYNQLLQGRDGDSAYFKQQIEEALN